MHDQPHRPVTSLSAVFPAYNDGGTIASMVLAAIQAMKTITLDYEVIVVNDGSRDYTAQMLSELAALLPALKVIHHDQNQGYGTTLRDGFSIATKEWIFYTDGDAQYNPLELVDLARVAGPDVAVVNGYKITRHDSLARKLIGRIYHNLARWAFGFKLRDVNCDFRLMRRAALDSIHIESVSGTLGLEIVKKLQDSGYNFVEVPVHHYPRPYGVSQFINFRHLFSTARQLAQLWWKLVVKKSAQRPDRL